MGNKSTLPPPNARVVRRRLIGIAERREDVLDEGSQLREAWHHLASGWRGCGWTTLFENRSNGTVVGLPDHCDRPLCPYCERRRIARLRDRYRMAHDRALADRRLLFAVLTIPNCARGDLAAAYERLRRAITKLRRQRWFAELVAGGLWRLELTVNRDQRTWHPHVNLLIETHRRVSMRRLQPQLQAAWRRALGEGAQQWVWLSPGWSGALPEAIKGQVAWQVEPADSTTGPRDTSSALDYTAKPPSVEWIQVDDPEWVVEYIESQRGRRQAAAFGSWRRQPQPKAEHDGELLVEAPWAPDDPPGRVRQLPQYDPTLPIAGQAPADWVHLGREPRTALRAQRPPDGGGEWLVWRPGDGPRPDALDDDPPEGVTGADSSAAPS